MKIICPSLMQPVRLLDRMLKYFLSTLTVTLSSVNHALGNILTKLSPPSDTHSHSFTCFSCQLFFLNKMTLLSAVPVDPNTFDNSSSSVDSLLIGSSSPVKCEDQTPERWDKATMVRETVKVTFLCT